ncbi:Flp family type IVb pilin [Aquipuribacter hungaricus]|uniref:Flp family type IVb pilin n=1 Tax=Aquipuribacter hungaricus TaxID=545624 RepID=A0ABV7WEY4_9MICO
MTAAPPCRPRTGARAGNPARTPLRTRDEGASAVEYGLLVAGIAAVVIVIVFALGGTLDSLFGAVDECASAASATGCAAPAGDGLASDA